MAENRPLPQEFPRDLALLRLDDVTPDLAPGARESYVAAFEARRADPLRARGLILVGPRTLRPLMALMRLVVLRLRDLNFERFEQFGGEGRYLSAYVRGESLRAAISEDHASSAPEEIAARRAPLPERAAALFIEGAQLVDPDLAAALVQPAMPLFVSWDGPEEGPVWTALTACCDVLAIQ